MTRTEKMGELLWRFVPVLIIGQVAGSFWPNLLHPRTTFPAFLAWGFAVLAWLTFAPQAQKRTPFGSLLILSIAIACTLGIVLYGWSWHDVVIGDPSRRAGGLDWLSWTIVGLCLPMIVTTRERWDQVLLYVMALAVINTVSAITEPYRLFITWAEGRRFGLTANPGFYGLIAMSGTIVAIYFALTKKGLDFALGVVLTPLLLYGMWLSGTRAAFLGLAAGVFFLPMRSRGVWVLGGLLLLPTAWLMVQRGLDPIRADLWVNTLREIFHAPWGHGFMTFAQHNFTVAEFLSISDFPHNMLLQVAYEQGIQGLLVALVGLVFMAKRLRGEWLALGVGWFIYSMLWIPSPAWFLVYALLIGRAAYRVPAPQGAAQLSD